MIELVLILGFLVVVALGLPSLLTWILLKKFKKVGLALSIGIWALLSYFVYSAIFPGENWYREEFAYYLGQEFPAEATFLYKSASYPGPHGDYFAVFVAQLSEEGIDQVINKLELRREGHSSLMAYRKEVEKALGEKIDFEYYRAFGDYWEYKEVGIQRDSRIVVFCLTRT